jgi:PAS domain S-box-containing protein
VSKLRSARSQAILAILVLMVLLGATTALATWRAQHVREAYRAVDRHSAAAAALDNARAETFLMAAQMASSIFSEDTTQIINQYPKSIETIDEDVNTARVELTALGEMDEVAALAAVDSEMNQLMQDPDVVALVTSPDSGTKIELGRQYYPRIWPRVETMMADLAQLADGQRSKLATERAAARHASDYAFGLLIGFSLLAFLAAFATLGIFIMSLLRPLASLRQSAREITSGNLKARAKVSGPEETASLARDFNEMTETLVERSAQLQDSEGSFRSVLEVSRDLIYKLNLQTRTYDYMSPSTLPLLGFEPEEIIAMGLAAVRDRFHPEDREKFKAQPTQGPNDSVEHRMARTIEYRFQCKDGEYRWFSDNRAFVHDEDGKALAVVGTVRDITDWKKAEAALRESEEKFRTLSALAPIGIFQTDMQGKFTYVNDHLLGIHAVRLEELLGEAWIRHIHPDDRRATIEEALKAEREVREFSREYRIVRPQGEIRWLRVGSSPVLSRDGNLVSYVGAVEDVTERKQAEAALRESEEKFRTLSASAPIGIFLADTQGNSIYSNENAVALIGGTSEDGLGRTWTRYIHPDDREAVKTESSAAAADRHKFSMEYRILTKDGQTRWVHTTVIAIRSPEGVITSYLGTIEDVTDRKHAEAALRESEERFRSLSAAAPIGILLVDDKDGLVYCNERLVSIFGLPLEEMLGFGWAKSLHPDDREAFFDERSKAVAEGREFIQEFRTSTPQGETRWLSVHTTPLLSQGGVSNTRVGTLEDITEQRRAEEEMANRLRVESAVARASNLLAGSEDADAALNLALNILGEGFGAERGIIWVTRGKNRAYVAGEWCSPGVTKVGNLQDFDTSAQPWLVERMLRAEPIIAPDVSELPPEAALEREAWERLGIRSLLAVSLMSRGRSIGCVIFSNADRTRDWAEEDVRLLRLAAESISSFLERQRSAEERRSAYERIVLLLATAAEARDPYTEHHLHRIRGYAEAIATEMGLPPEEISDIGLCSLLHDLGKLRVPDSILTKPGPLSQEEWEVMKKHPLWGEELLSTHNWMKTARHIARWHHERWDGSGYPDGLRGEQIPVSAAIVTVADGLDAMTSERPYKGAWPPQRAIQEIRAQKGRQYSPAVVEAFNRALRKGAIKRVAVEATHIAELSRAA